MNALPRSNDSQESAVILIVDEDPLLLTATAAALHLLGHECHCAGNPEAALKAARMLQLELVICDVLLEGHSGLELCREIKKLDGLANVPMMFIAANQLPDIIRRAFDSKGAYFLRKPFDTTVLLELVDKALWMPHLVHSQMSLSREPVGSA